MSDVPGARDDRETREMLDYGVHEPDARFGVIDRQHEHLRVLGTSCVQKIEPRRVPVVDAKTEALQELDLIRIVIEHGRPDTTREKEPPDDLTEAPEPRDDDRGMRVL